MVELRDELATLLTSGRAAEVRGDMEAMRPLFPVDIWNANIQTLVPVVNTVETVPRITVKRRK